MTLVVFVSTDDQALQNLLISAAIPLMQMQTISAKSQMLRYADAMRRISGELQCQ
jgi:hypothetical protein